MKKNNKIQIKNLDIFLSFLLLGLTSFGGPIAHIGYFREFFVKQKKWLDEKLYADFVSLCNFLPGPSSSQVSISIVYYFKGIKGAILAWVGFTMPSVIILMLFGYTILNYDNFQNNVVKKIGNITKELSDIDYFLEKHIIQDLKNLNKNKHLHFYIKKMNLKLEEFNANSLPFRS